MAKRKNKPAFNPYYGTKNKGANVAAAQRKGFPPKRPVTTQLPGGIGPSS